MKNFWTVFQFEFRRFLKNKVFVGISVFLILLVALILFFPRITAEADTALEQEALPIMLVKTDKEIQQTMQMLFASAFPEYEVQSTEMTADAIQKKIATGEIACAFVSTDATTYTYYTDDVYLLDINAQVAESVLQQLYQSRVMLSNGLDSDQVAAVLNTPILVTTENLNQEQLKNLPYANVVLIALYLIITLFGQLIASRVASEKSTRAMELLITSAKTTDLMFGKIIAACTASLLQLGTVFGAAIVCYNLNKQYWVDDTLITSLFTIPPHLIVYMVVFLVLGYLIYAFISGAIGSVASKEEDINTLTLPLYSVIFVTSIIIDSALTLGGVDSAVMKFCSFFPLTSPMAMFARICIGSVSAAEIALSLGILIVSTILVGILAAKIYKVGVLLYGKRPNLRTILKAIRES